MIDCWTCTEQYFSLYIQVEKRTSNKTLTIEYRSNKLKGIWICSFHTVGFSIRGRWTCNNGHSFVFVDSTQPMLSLQKVFFLPHMKLCPISISQDSLRWSTWCHQKLIIYCKYVSMFLISWDLHVLDFDLMYKLFINYICMNVW
jgi:hypothetical protein